MPRSSRQNSGSLILLAFLLGICLAYLWLKQKPVPPANEGSQARHNRSGEFESGREHAGREHEARRPRAWEAEPGYEHSRKASDPSCSALGITCSSQYFEGWQQPAEASCVVRVDRGNAFPDPRCTPGGIDPSITSEVLRNPNWRTRCDRNCETSEAQKHIAYEWYGIRRPSGNSGENQVCELDHLVPLELGGADGLGNIWPECGPENAQLPDRNFKIKDRVENYLADEVKAGRMPLETAQRGIAEDWSQYLGAADAYCRAGGRC